MAAPEARDAKQYREKKMTLFQSIAVLFVFLVGYRSSKRSSFALALTVVLLPLLAIAPPSFADTISLTSPEQFKKFVDRYKNESTDTKEFEKKEIATNRFAGIEGHTFRLLIDANSAPYDYWGEGKKYPGYFTYDANSEVVKIQIDAGEIGDEAFNFSGHPPSHGSLAAMNIGTTSLFYRVLKKGSYIGKNGYGATTRVSKEDGESYYIAYEGNPFSQSELEFPYELSKAKGQLKDLRLVVEFQPEMRRGAKRAVGRSEYISGPTMTKPSDTYQVWSYLYVKPKALFVINSKTRQVVYSVTATAPPIQ